MFYRPDFCCGCGEKIERTDWKPWTSTRFCDLCATDHQVIEIGPKILGVVAILAVSLGIGSLMKSQSSPGPTIVKHDLEVRANTLTPASNFRTTDAPSNQSQRSLSLENANAPKSVAPVANSKSEPPAVSGPVYFCGAATKKGTPCTRKVKGNVRCWQHQGMPAMLPPDKLLISK